MNDKGSDEGRVAAARDGRNNDVRLFLERSMEGYEMFEGVDTSKHQNRNEDLGRHRTLKGEVDLA